MMKFLHTADWHIGKKLHDFSLFDDQRDAFEQIEQIALREKVDAVVIAGDLYDRSVPSEDAVRLLDQMLIQLNLKDHLPVLAINGNHDSAVRLNTGSDWFKATNLYMNTKLKDAFTPVVIGDTQFFLLPYFELPAARNYFKDTEIHNLNDAMKLIFGQMKAHFENDKKHVLVAHFFAAGSSHCDSETQVEVGGLDAVALDLMEDFDYVALGHLHSKNALHHPRMKYSGSPVKFSVSEAQDEKGVWIIDTDQKDEMTKWVPLTPKNDIVVLQESFATLTDPKFYRQVGDDQFVAIRLTDKEIIPNIMNRLREFYPRVISFQRQNGRNAISQESGQEIKKLTPLEMLETFYYEATGDELSLVQKKFAKEELAKAERSVN